MQRWLLLTLLTGGCGPASATFFDTGDDDEAPPDDGAEPDAPDDTDDDAPPVDSPVDTPEEPDDTWVGAWLDVVAPTPDFYDLGEEVPLVAVVRGDDGAALPFDAVVWSDERRGPQLYRGLDGGVVLEPGEHTVWARAALPDGSVLETAVSGVRVQHPRTGIYAGSIVFTTISMFQGNELRNSCVGALDFTVDVRGDGFQGSGGCVLNLPAIGQVDLAYDVVGELDDPAVSGDVLIDAVVLDLPVPWEGGFTGPLTLEGEFAAEAFLFDLEGSLEARRITRFVQP